MSFVLWSKHLVWMHYSWALVYLFSWPVCRKLLLSYGKCFSVSSVVHGTCRQGLGSSGDESRLEAALLPACSCSPASWLACLTAASKSSTQSLQAWHYCRYSFSGDLLLQTGPVHWELTFALELLLLLSAIYSALAEARLNRHTYRKSSQVATSQELLLRRRTEEWRRIFLGFFPSSGNSCIGTTFYKENHTRIFFVCYDTLKKQTKADGLWQGRII